jgi:hypothetical protein
MLIEPHRLLDLFAKVVLGVLAAGAILLIYALIEYNHTHRKRP